MKLFIATLLLSQLSVSFASTIECISSKNGNTYLANVDEGIFKLIESSQKTKYEIHGLSVKKELISNTPVAELTVFSYPDRAQVVFEVLETEGRLTGSFEDDLSIPCFHKN
jgi:hypothetical protein